MTIVSPLCWPSRVPQATGRLHAEFLRLLFWHAHRESEELFKLTGQLAQPNQDAVFSKRAAFFNSLKSKVGHIMAKASALRVNMNLAPTVLSTSRARTSTSHAPLLYALNLFFDCWWALFGNRTAENNLSHHLFPPIAHNARE